MILRPDQIRLLRLGHPATPCNGGGGSSSSHSDTTTTNTSTSLTQDRRLVTDNGAIGVSADNSTVTISTTDHGAIDAAAQIAHHSLDLAQSLSTSSNDLAKSVLDSNRQVVEQSTAQTQAALQVVSSVVSKPLDMNDPQHKLVAVGMAAVAIVAVMAFKGK